MSKDDATQEGVSSEQQGADEEQRKEQQDPPKSMRELGMEMLEQRRNEELAAEGVDVGLPAEEKKAEDTDLDQQITQQTTKDEGEASASEPPAEAEHVQAAAPQMVKVKVNGKEELVPLETVIARYQKDNAADVRLQEATKLLSEARAERDKAATEKEKVEADKKVAAAEGDLTAVKANFFDAVYAGESEKAKEALDKIIEESVTAHLKGRGNATSDEEIVARVTPAVEQSLEAKSALRKFQKDFPKIAFDPYLAAKADVYLKEALADGKTSYEQALKTAGDKTTDWLRDTLGVKPAVTASTAVSERTERKRGIDNPPSTSAKTPTHDAPLEQNVAASISEMRAQRVASG